MNDCGGGESVGVGIWISLSGFGPQFDASLALWVKGGCRSAEEVRQFRVERGLGLFDGQQVLGPVATQDKLAMPTWAV
jgi:hypothetical protein